MGAPKSNSPQTVVVHNLGCIRNIKPQKQNFVPRDFREVQHFKYTEEQGPFSEYIPKLTAAAAVVGLFFLEFDGHKVSFLLTKSVIQLLYFPGWKTF